MARKKNGGPAFPRPLGNNGRPNFEDSEVSADQEGMSLRDYFAGLAMSAYLASPNGEIGDIARENPQRAAAWSYENADAMLAAREKADA